VELLFLILHSSGTPKVVNVSPKRFKQYGVLADLPLLTDENGKTGSTVATVGLLFKTLRRKVAYLLISNGKPIQKKFH
jgi:hypothetical protein